MLISMGEMATATQSLSDDALGLVAAELGYEAEIVGIEEEEAEEEQVDDSRGWSHAPPSSRSWATSTTGRRLLLDSIRQTDVVSEEFGGITQHIGAYQAT